MYFTEGEKNLLLTRTRSLIEVLNTPYDDKYIPEQELEAIEDLLTSWEAILADNGITGKTILERRLESRKLSIRNIETLLQQYTVIKPYPLKRWVRGLEHLLNRLGSEYIEDISLFEANSSIPFYHLLQAIAQIARRDLEFEHKDLCRYACDSALDDLELSLVRKLSWLCRKTLLFEFKIYRQQPKCNSIACKKEYGTSSLYISFITYLARSGFKNVCLNYPVLGMLMMQCIENWKKTTVDFFDRYIKDSREIGAIFLEGEENSRISNIKSDISDSHNEGQGVMAITFENKRRLIYKPRSVGIEYEYNNVLRWLNASSEVIDLKTFVVIPKDTYGWCEFIENDLLSEANYSLDNYYYKIGQLLCIAYILEATDLHFENVHNNMGEPVLIDLETLLQPRTREVSDPDEHDAAHELVSSSVIRTLLLPQWRFSTTGDVKDISGIGGFYERGSTHSSYTFDYVNTDLMDIVVKHDELSDTTTRCISKYHNAIIRGFRLCYMEILRLRSLLLAEENKLLPNLFSQPIRYLFRSTHNYHALRERSISPSRLVSSLQRSFDLDILTKHLFIQNICGDFLPIIEHEIRELEHLDIPYFTASAVSATLSLGTLKFKDYFIEPSATSVLRKISSMSLSDLNTQQMYIEQSISSRMSVGIHADSDPQLYQSLLIKDGYTKLSILPIDEAVRLASLLLAQFNYDHEGTPFIVSSVYSRRYECFTLQRLGFDLYDGTLGVALFLSALTSALGRDSYQRLALQLVESTMRRHRTHGLLANDKDPASLMPGGIVGFGSILYSLVKIASFLRWEQAVDYASELASSIRFSDFAQIRDWDVLSGLSGLLLALLSLYQQTDDSNILVLAEMCGERLLSNSTCVNSLRIWKAQDGIAYTGFAHGAAGIVYAMSCLYKLTNRQDFLIGAREGYHYLMSAYDRQVKGWKRDLSPAGESSGKYGVSWCHGFPGIGLSFLGGYYNLGDSDLLHYAYLAVEICLEQKDFHTDTLCCGNLGKTDLLLESYVTLGDSALFQSASNHARNVMHRAAERSHYGFNRFVSFHPGFFQGVSGVGYELLRVYDPIRFPSILLLK